MSAINHFVKDPAAIKDYTIRWTNWLAGSDTISSSSWTVPSGIVKTAESNTTTDAVLWLASGTVGQVYEPVNRVITAGGRQDERTISILVENK